jgi:hypothetical protein
MKNRKLTVIILSNKEVMQLLDEYNLALNPSVQKDAADFPSEGLSVETLNSIKNKVNQILGQGENADFEK